MPDFRPDRHDHLRPSRLPLVLLALLVLAAAGYGFYRWKHRAAPAGAPTATQAAAPAGEAAPAPASASAAAPAPAPDAATTRSLLESLSPLDAFRRWVADADAVRRWAVVTDNLAEGVSPRRQLTAFAPAQPFSVSSEGAGLTVSPASYRRYDAFADAVAAVDVPNAVRVYRALKGPLEAAYRALGYPDRVFDQVTERALLRLERAPVRDGPVEVVKTEGLYAYADPALEALGAVEKHLLRMGPRNERLVQAKAKALREALFPGASGSAAAGAGR